MFFPYRVDHFFRRGLTWNKANRKFKKIVSLRGNGTECINPAGTQHQNDVVSTSMRRDHVASTLIRRHFNVVCPLGSSRVISQQWCRWGLASWCLSRHSDNMLRSYQGPISAWCSGVGRNGLPSTVSSSPVDRRTVHWSRLLYQVWRFSLLVLPLYVHWHLLV